MTSRRETKLYLPIEGDEKTVGREERIVFRWNETTGKRIWKDGKMEQDCGNI